MFWSSLFASLLPARPPLWVQAASVAVAVTVAAAWYGLVALVFSLGTAVRADRRARRWVDAVLGLRLAVSE